MNPEIATTVALFILLILFLLPPILSYRLGSGTNEKLLFLLMGFVLSWIGWIAVKIIASGKEKQEAKDQANAEAMLRHRMRQARGDLID